MLRRLASPALATVALLLASSPAASAASAPPVVAPVATGHLLVGGGVDVEAVRSTPGTSALRAIGPSVWSLEVLVGHDPDDVATDLVANGDVGWAEPDAALEVAALPQDPGMHLLWGLGPDTTKVGVDVDAPEAWETTFGSPDVLVAVVDSGMDIRHPDLVDRIWANPGEIAGNGLDDDRNGFVDDVHGWDFVDRDASVQEVGDSGFHATHVAGTIAGSADGQGIVGVAPGVRLLPLRALDAAGAGRTSDAVAAITYAARMGARVVNASWGSPDRSQALYDTIRDTGVLVVAATGNSGADIDVAPAYPAAFDLPNVLSVTSVAEDGRIPDFANTGARSADVGAPGVDIVSAAPDGAWAYSTGTSMAAPHATGVAALLASVAPEATGVQLATWIRDGARPHAPLAGRTSTGGVVDADDALAIALDEARTLRRAAALAPGEVDRSGSPTARTVDVACPEVATAAFGDTAGTAHERTITCVAGHGIARGRADGTYGPGLSLTAAQTAAFLRRTLEVAGAPVADATTSPCAGRGGALAADIEALVEAGVVPASTCADPGHAVTRGEMASWTSRALDHAGAPPSTAAGTWYDDDAGHVAEQDIDRLTDFGIVTGRGARAYGPDERLSRAQMATFLARLLDVLLQDA